MSCGGFRGFAARGAMIHSVQVRLAPDIEGQALENLKRLFEEVPAKYRR